MHILAKIARTASLLTNKKTREFFLYDIGAAIFRNMYRDHLRRLSDAADQDNEEEFYKLQRKLEDELGYRYHYIRPDVIRLETFMSFLDGSE